MTAPAESTLGDVAEIPTASPLGTNFPDAGVAPAPAYQLASRNASSNRIAVVALVLACGTVALLGAADLILAPHSEEIAELEEAMRPARTFAERMQIQSEFIEDTGGFPEWMLAGALCVALAGVAWLGSIVCAVIGLRRAQRRRLAAIALVIAAVVPVFFCCGGLVGVNA